MGNLSPHFSTSEFACHCGCGLGSRVTDISSLLVDLLERIRAEIGRPIKITSGVRCPIWNARSGGVSSSPHLRGTAADIFVSGGEHRYAIVRAALANGAEGVGVAKTFIHVDMDEEVQRPMLWTY